MGVPFHNPQPMTADEFFAFTATRPDEEKWELIDGQPIMNASASFFHQVILKNLVRSLTQLEELGDVSWISIPGIGVRVSETSVPVPDLLIRPNTRVVGSECDDMIVAFEILSPSTANRDLRLKRKAYTILPSFQQYVIVAQDFVEVFSYDRANAFAERRLNGLDLKLDIPTLRVALPLSDIYRGVDPS
jgi:Uma2 family endonuclease